MSNIEKIQKMVKGIYNRPIQTGYEAKTTNQRKKIVQMQAGRKPYIG